MVEEIKEELTFWQKLKQLTGVITAVTGLIAVLGGSGFFFWNKNDQQDKVQETTYNFLAQRVEELTSEVKVLKETTRNLENTNNRLLDQIENIRYGRRIEKIDRSIEVLDKEPEMITIITNEIDNPDAPPKMEYRGAARLPNFKNIQQVVTHLDSALDAAE